MPAFRDDTQHNSFFLIVIKIIYKLMSIDPNDFAFLYFVITILIIILIPLTINVVKPILRGKDPKYRKAPKCM